MISVDSGLKAIKAQNVPWDDVLQAIKVFVFDTKITIYDTLRRLVDNRGTHAGGENIHRLISLVGLLFDEAEPFAPLIGPETMQDVFERLSRISGIPIGPIKTASWNCDRDGDLNGKPNLITVRRVLLEMGHEVL